MPHRLLPLFLLLVLLPHPGLLAADRPNVLMIAVDDLRPSLGCYGDTAAVTPNLDRLAARGVVFTRAYCQQAVCSPSRTSLLTGRLPDTTKVWDLETHFRVALPDVVTLPQHFKNHGYAVHGLSKVFHGNLDDAPSWSVPHWKSPGPAYGPEGRALLARLQAQARAAGRDPSRRDQRVNGPAVESPDVADDELADGLTAADAIRRLGALRDEPFFLAVGFLKPHLPFVAPKKYWDLHDPARLPQPPALEPHLDAPAFAATNFAELRNYHGLPKSGPLDEAARRRLIHGYYAAASYTDAQIGRVLDELDRLDLAKNTIVVVWGDHGWQLGDHGLWCKHTNYERAVHAPLIVSVPGLPTAGRSAAGLVEFVDLYPTLVDLAGLPPASGLEGRTFRPLLEDPSRPGKTVARSQYPRQAPGLGRLMGYTIRTDRHRLVEWRPLNSSAAPVYELYDYQADPHETRNLASSPDHAPTLASLKQLLTPPPSR